MDIEKYKQLLNEIAPFNARLVAVSKTKPVEDIVKVYAAGQRIFGENKVQEMAAKYEALPKDIEWHLIGHLQTNKVKYIAPFVSLIHSVDSLKLLQEIDKQAQKQNRIIDCLLQIFIAQEETKFGLSTDELNELLQSTDYGALKNIRICGFMAMASNTDNEAQIAGEFALLQKLFGEVKSKYFVDSPHFKELSMGMSSDYKIALKYGATLIRVGSMIFGER
ncbi:MAG TPA: YggS family pyridoxal phosphate-dependent enzyme [Chitinophagales bacterium]|nr:YggS family pyridoxal phosphate-dependent enzyme [Chitinophagales bacterium]